MPDIVHLFPIRAPVERVYDAISTPKDLDAWWTLQSSGNAEAGGAYTLFFGHAYDWRAEVVEATRPTAFELHIVDAHEDWTNTRVRFELTRGDDMTNVLFRQLDWKTENEHYRVSCYCWAMYLRLLKRYLEAGEVVEYSKRLDV